MAKQRKKPVQLQGIIVRDKRIKKIIVEMHRLAPYAFKTKLAALEAAYPKAHIDIINEGFVA